MDFQEDRFTDFRSAGERITELQELVYQVYFSIYLIY